MKRLAVLGQPIAHSRSPAMHNAAFAELGLSGEWSYEAIEVTPEEFSDRVRSLAGEGYVGANVTVPHKEAALALADDPSETARAIGAANTLGFEAGRVWADNTDAAGLLESLPGSPRDKRALVLGAGGAARAAVWGLSRRGAEVEVWNRTPGRADALASYFDVSVAGFDAEHVAPEYDLIVNATSVGLETGAGTFEDLPIDPERLHAGQIVVDLVYGSEPTELVRAAESRGATVVDGLEVLVRQGAASFRIWTGLEPPLDAMRRAARA